MTYRSELPQLKPRHVRDLPNEPRLRRCAICQKLLESFAFTEERPSGPYHEIEIWAYCPMCWAEHREICRSSDEELLLRRVSQYVLAAPRRGGGRKRGAS